MSTLRADARRNREQLVAAATEAFGAGRPISLDAIARRAGVGSGTLYRHFPTREDLVEEVYSNQLDPLRVAAATLSEQHAPAIALRLWMVELADWVRERQGICEAIVAMSASDRFGTGPVCDEVQQILDSLLRAGVRSGDVDAGTDVVDVAQLLAGVLSVAGGTGQEDQLDRMLRIVVDGLRSCP